MSFLVLCRDDLPDPGPRTSLYVSDCITRKTPKIFLPNVCSIHLFISDLELTSSSGHRFLIDVSTLTKDAVLDTSSFTGFSYDMTTADAARHAVMVAVASPVERLQLVSPKPSTSGGYRYTGLLQKTGSIPPQVLEDGSTALSP